MFTDDDYDPDEYYETEDCYDDEIYDHPDDSEIEDIAYNYFREREIGDAYNFICQRHKEACMSTLKGMLDSLKEQSREDIDLYFDGYSPSSCSTALYEALDNIYKELMDMIFKERLEHTISSMPKLPSGYEYVFEYIKYSKAPFKNNLKKFIHSQKKTDPSEIQRSDEIHDYFDVSEDKLEKEDLFFRVLSVSTKSIIYLKFYYCIMLNKI